MRWCVGPGCLCWVCFGCALGRLLAVQKDTQARNVRAAARRRRKRESSTPNAVATWPTTQPVASTVPRRPRLYLNVALQGVASGAVRWMDGRGGTGVGQTPTSEQVPSSNQAHNPPHHPPHPRTLTGTTSTAQCPLPRQSWQHQQQKVRSTASKTCAATHSQFIPTTSSCSPHPTHGHYSTERASQAAQGRRRARGDRGAQVGGRVPRAAGGVGGHHERPLVRCHAHGPQRQGLQARAGTRGEGWVGGWVGGLVDEGHSWKRKNRTWDLGQLSPSF